jgi:hypothetical protein
MRALVLDAGFVLAVLVAACVGVIAVAVLFPAAAYCDVIAGVAAGWAALELLPDPPCPFPCCQKGHQ